MHVSGDVIWASLVVQLVKNPSATRETWVQSLGWEDPLEKGMASVFGILVWSIPYSVFWPGGFSILAWRILWIV